ncbi:uncharacterized protein H6S33_000239 [Morchella sextelata]|uniref:uncharacterized protein n=1 Tax=Morchella sextelata TaxID=1174677 RepID=UPI001D04C555|nr:uncharacterized protein H6S33_000239 [Morchella sextelata]KAH0614603.1 hypothetical protein H6S33_000239 [Morchella sextelata]
MQNRLMQLRSSNSVNILPNSYYLPSTASYPWPQLLRSSARPRDWCEPQRQVSETIYYARITQSAAPLFIIYEEPALPPVEDGPFEAFWNRVLEFITRLVTYTTRSFGPTSGTRGRVPLRDLRLKDN